MSNGFYGEKTWKKGLKQKKWTSSSFTYSIPPKKDTSGWKQNMNIAMEFVILELVYEPNFSFDFLEQICL